MSKDGNRAGGNSEAPRTLRMDDVNVVIVLSEENYNKVFEQGGTQHTGWLQQSIYGNLRYMIRYVHSIYISLWLYWRRTVSNEYTILCCDSREDADIFHNAFGLRNIVLAEDVAIKTSVVSNLNKLYKRNIIVVQDESMATSNLYLRVNIPEDANIFLAMGEYDDVTNFELALQAFHIMYTRKLREMYLKKSTFLVILGDEIEFKERQRQYFKKLEGFVLKFGLKDNVYFLKIYPQVSKEMLMKTALAIIFTNVHGCYERNLTEAVGSGKHIIAPRGGFYESRLAELGLPRGRFLYEARPDAYSAQMYKHLRNRFLFRLQKDLYDMP